MDEAILEKVLRASDKIKLEPLKQWYCDHCEEIIDSDDKGWFEWLKERDGERQFDFRIVHHDKKCMHDERRLFREGYMTKDMHLDYYTGPDGLNNLLEILVTSGVEKSEVLKMIRRLNVPFYEQSLKYRQEAIEQGYFSGDPDLYNNVIDNLRLIQDFE
ncbi:MULTISPECIES: hypothetical protein [unclassified Mesobacillus]|uniref:hypothetical protein n=1 Tax=unclassified Mesobacillus TaxID=2675270 RepID=UPI00203D3698|nr:MULTISPECIES: hypothetical protein [unclassified Mesobacillus]MCM3122749.1 hypothetical protein [Mesobacillus sp. MER 33]MCM3232713.1 hypothetical protein [Mesobacillus sp. MER 48]